ncbi:MAG: ATP-binding protein [Thermodesulfovibrionales bacterium]|nr:ATP-binding protein [Thermodesulfovibrionales bacterium]
MLEQTINKLKTWQLLTLAVAFSELLTMIIVITMSVILENQIILDHLLIVSVTAFIVSSTVVCIIINILKHLQKAEKSLQDEITDRKQTEEILRSFGKALETMQIGVTITDTDGKILYTNPADAHMHGYSVEELLSKNARIFAPQHSWHPMTLQQVKEMKSWRREGTNIRKDGSSFPVQLMSDVVMGLDGQPIGIVTTSEDITSRKKIEEILQKSHEKLENLVTERTARLSETVRMLEEQIAERNKLESQLRHSQKMEAVGQLAGGVAHDFNNILTAIIGYGNLLRMKLQEEHLKSYADQLLASADRAANLTHSLLTFSRKQPINPKPVDLNDLVKKTTKFLQRLISEDIELKAVPADKDLIVMADSGQIEQVLINLAANARDVMPEGGILTINTMPCDLDNEYVKAHGYGVPGTYALISITDTGTGMDEEIKKKIFEPFFTTKEVGKGTGLGLAIVYGIIKQHNGYINCKSELGKGTTFEIFLPVISLKVEALKAEELSIPLCGKETILFAEDDNDVRKFMKGAIEDFGYKVIDAVDGEDAINKFIENQNNIDLLLLDVVMPRKNGKEVYRAIKNIKPDVKILFMSGYASDFIQRKEILDQGLNFISKPVSPTDILRKIREVLDK